MAPIPESSYFPALDKCLDGEQLLISWKSAFSAITSNFELESDHQAVLERFLLDPVVLAILAGPFDFFSEPSPQTKTAFETKTSAINVTPSSNTRYDIKELKEDALWLSKTVKIDEVLALRIVVLEYQSRASAQLQGRFSEEELTSLREAAGNSKYSSQIPVSLLSGGTDPEAIQKEFETEDNRRQRIFYTYLSERRYLLKCSERLFHVFFSFQDTQTENGKGKGLEAASSWLETIGKALYARMASRDTEEFILGCIKAITTNTQNLGTNSGWSGVDGEREDVESVWARNQLLEATHAMEIIWELLIFMLEIPSSQVALAWFRLQQGCEFFNNFESEDPSMLTIFLPMQSVSTMISLAMLPLGLLGWIGDRQNEDEVSPNAAADKPFILNTQTVAEINTIILNAADASLTTAGPAILAWSIILRTLNFRVLNSKTPQLETESSRFDRRSSTDTDITLVPDRYDDIMEQIKASLDEDVIDFLARSAVNICRVFETLTALSSRFGATSNAFFSVATGARMRMVILNLIKNSTAVGYIPEIVEATVSTLTGGQNYWDILDSKPLLKQDNPTRMFLQDEDLLNALLKSAQWRYPFESLPFLRMIRAVASYSSHQGRETSPTAISFLDALPMFTYQLPPDFVDYETMQEEDNNNNIRLLRPIQLFEQRSRGMGNQARSMALMVIDPDFHIPAGTAGRIISESGPRVAFWFHEYSGLKYFGKLLETFLTASDLVDVTTGQPADRDSVSEIIELLATLLLSIAQSAETNINWQSDALEVLEKASSGLSQSRDIMTVVFDIFEQELQNLASFSGSDVPLEVLVSCVHFIHALLPTSPGRVWPLLSKSGLLGVGSGSGQLSTIVEGVELISGRYNLLISCCRLYDSLVEDFATNAITRRSKGRSSGGTRYTQGADLGTGLPDQFLSKILLSFTRYMMDVFESAFAWKFVAQDDRHWISRSIGKTFDAILQYSYGLESAADATKEEDPKTKEVLKPETGRVKRKEKITKIMEALMPSASHIVEGFLSASSGTLRFQPLLRSYFDGLDTPDLSTFLNRLNLWTANVSNTLSFSKTLLRVSKVLERPTSQFESQLFKASPLIARLYVVNDTYRNRVVGLFEAMVVTASSKTSEPPSLLGHLGPNTAKNFLYLLSDLDKPLSRGRNVYSIWHFLSMVVSSRQQWFANYLLTGRTPRDASRTKISGRDLAILDKPLLVTALETLSKIDEIPRSETLAILEFVALAQNFWPWTVCDSPKYSGFISNISEFVGNLRPIQPSLNLEATIDACYQSRIAGYIAEVLAMHLFHTRQKGYQSTAKDLVPNLSYFTRFAVAVPSYNTSLHTMLKRNFEDKYPGCSLGDLKRTTLEDHQFGREYFYDLSLADKMLCLHQAWTGRKDDGLRNEFARANVNLSLVDAQIALFHSWKFLSIELSINTSTEPKLQEMLVKVAIDCLKANSKSQLQEEIFLKLAQTRADFAIVLVQRLIQANSTIEDMKTLLTMVWTTIEPLRGSFERVVPEADALYYRSLLKLLFLAVRIHAEAKPQPSEENFGASLRMAESATIVPTIINILKYVVSMGLRELVTAVHDSPADSSPEDIALLTGIMQSCLRIPGIELYHPQIVSMMMTNSTARVATTLFSWSDTLAIDGDPIYGELSMLFLLELSSIPLMAEQLAVDGLIGHISSANITSYLRRGNVGPFADGAGLQRCYSIWARGILPLLLNLLDAVQGSLATEVAVFLNQFQSLLTQCEQALDAPETNRIMPQGQPKYITLITCSEVHSVALLIFILNGFREALMGSVDIPEVKWDAAGVLENVEFWLGSRALLRERLLPMGDREVDMVRKKVSTGNAVSKLEEKVMAELVGIRDVLSGGDNA